MRKFLLSIVLLITIAGQQLYGQSQVFTSNNNTTADWVDYVWTKSKSWMMDRPRYDGNNSSPDFGYWHQVNINGYITRNGDLTVSSGGELNVNDTLRVKGDLYSQQTINVNSGGILIIEGDYITNQGGVNTVDGGKVVVLGNMTASNGADVDISSGDFYILGTLTSPGSGERYNGSTAPPSGYFGDESALQSKDPGLHGFATGSVLPVEFVAFNIRKEANQVIIQWTTASEINNDYFTVERSGDGVNFIAIGTVKGNGTTNTIHNYTFVDQEPLQSKSYYRVRQTDYDKKFDFSRTKMLAGNQVGSRVSFFPNPAVDIINVHLPQASEATIQVIDVMGMVQKTMITSEESYVKIDISNLKRGMYILSIDTNGKKESKRVLIK